MSPPHVGPEVEVAEAEVEKVLQLPGVCVWGGGGLSLLGTRGVWTRPEPPSSSTRSRLGWGPARLAQRYESIPSPAPGTRPRGRVRRRCAALTVLGQVVLALFSLHLLTPPFHAVPLRLEKLQKPVAVPVAH